MGIYYLAIFKCFALMATMTVLGFMVFLMSEFGLTEVYVKKPECPTRKGGPNLEGGDEWPWRFGSG